MTEPAKVRFATENFETIQKFKGSVATFVNPEGKLDKSANRLDEVCGGTLARLASSKSFKSLEEGDAAEIAFPAGLAARSLIVAKLAKEAGEQSSRKAGASIGGLASAKRLLVLAGDQEQVEYIAQGIVLRSYVFSTHKTGKDKKKSTESVTVMSGRSRRFREGYKPLAAGISGVFATRDLVNEPSNVLSTTEFGSRIEELGKLGLTVRILEEADLEKLGMRTLLAVGQGSESPSRVGIIEWQGGKGRPVAVIGKGVVFDTGGISIKPAKGMEWMTMDMAGAGVVFGLMKALAERRAKANVVGIVGLVENMPDGKAQRPGDVVMSMKGDTVEVINTDAEGRLVLADLLWYAQKKFQPTAMIDLATLTGAIIISLGHEYAGAFSNSDELCSRFISAADEEGEKAWRMPLAEPFDKMLKSRIADMKNVGNRAAGAITAAQFLQRFVRPDCPWLHLDIAGVASTEKASDFAPPGATGWGVRALDRMIRNGYETGG